MIFVVINCVCAYPSYVCTSTRCYSKAHFMYLFVMVRDHRISSSGLLPFFLSHFIHKRIAFAELIRPCQIAENKIKKNSNKIQPMLCKCSCVYSIETHCLIIWLLHPAAAAAAAPTEMLMNFCNENPEYRCCLFNLDGFFLLRLFCENIYYSVNFVWLYVT